MIVVSPYAKSVGYISHTQYEFGSIVRFVEDNWKLGGSGQPTCARRALRICSTSANHRADSRLLRERCHRPISKVKRRHSIRPTTNNAHAPATDDRNHLFGDDSGPKTVPRIPNGSPNGRTPRAEK